MRILATLDAPLALYQSKLHDDLAIDLSASCHLATRIYDEVVDLPLDRNG